MSLIQPVKFRTWETGHFKMPRLQTFRLQTGVFQMVVAVAFEHNLSVHPFVRSMLICHKNFSMDQHGLCSVVS